VFNPATGELLARSPVDSAPDVTSAVQATHATSPGWRSAPAPDRVQYLFRLKQLLDEHFEEISRLVTIENGKTLAEARGELRRGIENVEDACGIPTMMQGYNLD
jgi:malonate-semialdehyde dehydrogenase (acetylating) / methylmalonate-semialdehyde dehydrogenase